MKYKKIFFALLVSCLLVTFSHAAESWTTGAYANNMNVERTLTITGANKLSVTIVGETEKYYDFITILNSSNHIEKRMSGKINKSFIVLGNSVTIKFKSDYSITKSGITITIKDSENTDEKLILYPPKETVLRGESVYFHLAEGVTELRAYDQSIIESKMLTGVDTTKKNLHVCATKGNNTECIDYKVKAKNPFSASIIHKNDYNTYLILNGKAKTLHVYAENKLLLSKYLDASTSISLCTEIDWYSNDINLMDGFPIIIKTVLSGIYHGKLIHQSIIERMGTCEGP